MDIKKEKEKKLMELRVNEVKLPESMSFNYEELKQELSERVSMYETLVYTEDQIKKAKEDRSSLNKLKKALNDERIKREKEYMQPFNDFKSKINEIISIIDKPVALIDKQVKGYEEKQKADKLEEIKNYWNSCDVPAEITLEKVFDSKWLNASVSMKSIQDAIDGKLEQIKNDISSLDNLAEFSFEAKQVYISSLDLAKALNEAHRLSEIAKKKAEYEATQAAKLVEAVAKANEAEQVEKVTASKMEIVEPETQWISFSALLTIPQAQELKKFFDDRNIEFKAI